MADGLSVGAYRCFTCIKLVLLSTSSPTQLPASIISEVVVVPVKLATPFGGQKITEESEFVRTSYLKEVLVP